MNLLRADKDRFSFQLGDQEKHALIEVLKLYPLVPAGHQKISRTEAPAEDQQLLDEALAVQRAENRRQLQVMLRSRSRFIKNAEGHRFNLRQSQLEWLLQVLNDVRVGCWILLGSPEAPEEMMLALNHQTIVHFAAMEIALSFQQDLLHALTGGEPTPPPAETGD